MQLFSTRFRVGLLTYQTSFAIWRLLPRYPFIHKNIGTGLRLACQVSASGNIAVGIPEQTLLVPEGALYTGIHLLCRETGISNPTSMLIAGAFGSYIDKQDALTIGLFPEMNSVNLNIIGNAAGAGAILTLFDETYRQKTLDLAQSIHVIDLARHPDFQEVFMKSLSFPI